MKHCISFSLIITGVDNHSFLVLQISVIFTVFTQRNMSKVEVRDLTSSYIGTVKRVQHNFSLAFFAGSCPCTQVFCLGI